MSHWQSFGPCNIYYVITTIDPKAEYSDHASNYSKSQPFLLYCSRVTFISLQLLLLCCHLSLYRQLCTACCSCSFSFSICSRSRSTVHWFPHYIASYNCIFYFFSQDKQCECRVSAISTSKAEMAHSSCVSISNYRCFVSLVSFWPLPLSTSFPRLLVLCHDIVVVFYFCFCASSPASLPASASAPHFVRLIKHDQIRCKFAFEFTMRNRPAASPSLLWVTVSCKVAIQPQIALIVGQVGSHKHYSPSSPSSHKLHSTNLT